MKTNPRKALMQALGSAQLADFKTTEEMIASKSLHEMMLGNELAPKVKRTRKSKPVPEPSEN